MPSAPSVSYSITVRLELPARPTAVSELTAVVEKGGGLVTALDVTASGHSRVRVDLTCAARDVEHAGALVDAMRALTGVEIGRVSDRSAVLGLGNIGPLAALPVMEGKAALFKRFAGIDAFPICLDTQDSDEIVAAVKAVAPVFAGINLEDISAPRCFEIEARLRKELSIPVFHDDQHGTAIVTLAALTNALRVVGKQLPDVRIVMSGAGAAGTAILTLLLHAGARDVVVCDVAGVVEPSRPDVAAEPASTLYRVATITNPRGVSGTLREAL